MNLYSKKEDYNRERPLEPGDLIYADFREPAGSSSHFLLYQHKWLRVNACINKDDEGHIYTCSYDPALNQGEAIVLPFITFREGVMTFEDMNWNDHYDFHECRRLLHLPAPRRQALPHL